MFRLRLLNQINKKGTYGYASNSYFRIIRCLCALSIRSSLLSRSLFLSVCRPVLCTKFDFFLFGGFYVCAIQPFAMHIKIGCNARTLERIIAKISHLTNEHSVRMMFVLVCTFEFHVRMVKCYGPSLNDVESVDDSLSFYPDQNQR